MVSDENVMAEDTSIDEDVVTPAEEEELKLKVCMCILSTFF